MQARPVSGEVCARAIDSLRSFNRTTVRIATFVVSARIDTLTRSQEALMDDPITHLRELLETSRFTVAITGAGISMSAGILDMEHMNMRQVAQTAMEPLVRARPEHAYRLLRGSFLDPMFRNGPTLAHRALAGLEREGRMHGIITTNIDHLHSLAGSQAVAEIQGSYAINRCVRCHLHHDDIAIWDQGKAPRCRECRGVVVSFPVYSRIGLNEPAFEQAGRWIAEADLVVAIGAKGNYGGYLSHMTSRTKIVQINPARTQFDRGAAIVFREKADDVFARLSAVTA